MHSVYVQGIPTKNMPFIPATGFRQSRGSWRGVEAGDPMTWEWMVYGKSENNMDLGKL